MPIQHKEKLVAYICALALHLDGFIVSPTVLAKDLQITVTKYL